MSLRQEIETWVIALKHYDEQDFETALAVFFDVADTSKILFNCGVIHATLGEHADAVDCYQRALQLDQYLAIAYFQQGVSNFLMADYEEALANFNDTLLYLRGNRNIDYSQLGLKFKLHSCEVLFNRGLCFFYLQQRDAAMSDLLFASREKAVPDHNVIDEAIKDRIQGYTVFSIPVGLVFRPNEAKVKNLRSKDYLGRACLVAQQQKHRPERRQHNPQDLCASLAADGDGSYAAMHLVKPGLTSRNRQQSEPPLSRAVFPPTPPPELERPLSYLSNPSMSGKPADSKQQLPRHLRTNSDDASPTDSATSFRRKPDTLDLGVAAFSRSPSPFHMLQKPSITVTPRTQRTTRSASDKPSDRRPAPAKIDTSFAQSLRDLTHITRSGNRLSLSVPSQPSLLADNSPPKHLAILTRNASRRRSYSCSNPAPGPSSGIDLPLRVGSIREADEFPESMIDKRNSGNSGGEEVDTPSSDGGGISITNFEMMDGRNSQLLSRHSSRRMADSVEMTRMVRRGSSRMQREDGRTRSRAHSRARTLDLEPPRMARVRIKLHTSEETRCLTVDVATAYAELVGAVRTKLGINCGCKIKMQDEDGDLVTLGDADDWDMCLDGVKKAARRDWEDNFDVDDDCGELGKLELWVSEAPQEVMTVAAESMSPDWAGLVIDRLGAITT